MTIQERADWIEEKAQALGLNIYSQSAMVEFGLALLTALAHITFSDEQWEAAALMLPKEIHAKHT